MRGARAARAARVVGLAAVAVLLTSCDGSGPAALACKVDVDTPDLVSDREAAGIADCTELPTAAGASDLPDISLHCLGSTASMSLADVKGPAIINFWSTTCGPCREEMPVLQQFHEKYGDQVPLLGVNFLDTYPGAAIDFARIKGVTYPSAADPCGDLQESDLVLQVLPQFVFVRADGSFEQRAGGIDSLAEIVTMAEDNLGIELTAAGRAS
ncbi:thiol-disulfide isomerase/thioredoxin [Nocardioides aromaticivorans]|uniref:Thiol-disulfide isomerase/thioredoxin n=1 Tax=Nocardioides aromaticivorans TaxID=200618 RepID=A0A7Z0CP10_9ACTN|nr:TlpA disulfide reductase family protein [Nocardioides aromaticivorans]NYI45435.1 thiol-disulfide isomerase/thioredoxin [Nocardioides aromaticivorans]